MNMEQNNDLYPNPEQKKESEMWKGASWNSFFCLLNKEDCIKVML